MVDPDESKQLDDSGINETNTGFGPAPELVPTGAIEEPTIVATDNERKADKIRARADEYSSAASNSSGDEQVAKLQTADRLHALADKTEGSPEDVKSDKTEIPKMQTINVTRDFPWTYSPSTSREDVPTMILREERILQNPVFNALAYNLFTATDHIPKSVSEKSNEIANEATNWITDKGGKAVSFLGASERTKKAVETSIKSAAKVVEALVEQDELPDKYKNWTSTDYRRHLEPYQRLYSTFPTGFKYKIPYFDDAYKQAQGGFGSDTSSGQLPFQSVLENIGGFVSSAVQALNATSPGTYVEQPKYPGFPASEKSYTLNFMLHNTVSWEDTLRNWQLVFMLIYQNIPNRVNRTVILPPKIYEARLPGVWYSRYSYMSTVAVQMQGARRDMKIDTTNLGLPGDLKEIKTTVPDAYQVSITLQELIPESQNYMFESIIRDSLVTIDDRDSTDANKPFQDSVAAGGAAFSGAVNDVTQQP